MGETRTEIGADYSATLRTGRFASLARCRIIGAMTRSHVRALLGWLFGLSPILGCGPSPTPADHPNIILITLDTTRADKLGCYGGKSDVSPAVDGLARSGVVFEHAYAAVPLTLPEHTTILTGLYPSQHGVHDNAIYHVSPDVSTLAEVLKEAGYQTAAFISAFVLEAQFGLDQGFDRYERSEEHTSE